MGKDSIEPFIQNPEKGVFLLCKTSNAGSGDLQDMLVLDDERGKTKEGDLFPSFDNAQDMLSSFVPLYIKVAQLAQTWNTNNNIGIVVGATHPQIMSNIRAAAPELWFLAPGVGAQGGELESALRAGLRQDGRGMLIPISRGISHAQSPAKAAAELRDQIVNIKREMRMA